MSCEEGGKGVTQLLPSRSTGQEKIAARKRLGHWGGQNKKGIRSICVLQFLDYRKEGAPTGRQSESLYGREKIDEGTLKEWDEDVIDQIRRIRENRRGEREETQAITEKTGKGGTGSANWFDTRVGPCSL